MRLSVLFYITQLKQKKNNENVLMAASLAQDVMEQLRSVPYSEVKQKLSGGDITLREFYGSSPSPSLDNLPQVRDLSKIIKLSEDEKGMEVVVEIRWKELPKGDPNELSEDDPNELPEDDLNELPEDDLNERSYRVATYFLEGGLNDYLSPAPTP